MKNRIFTNGAIVTLFAAVPLLSFAQDFDDDIYYNPSKKTKTQIVKTSKTQTPVHYTPTPDYPSADTYQFSTNSGRDVDEYNRRYLTADTVAQDSAIDDNFTYTRRIERFHNPDVVISTNDGDLIDTYYNTPASSLNIYVNNYPGYYWNRWPYYSWTYPYWSWSWNYNPWYWGPSYTWGWGYDPYWSWSWGPGYYPGYWGPSYYPPRPPRPTAWRPSSPGSSRPHQPVGSWGTSNRRPGSVAGGSSINSGSGFSRPGNMGRGRNGYSGTTTYPSTTRPSSPTNTGVYTPNAPANTRPGTSVGTRGRNNGSSAGSTNQRRSSSNSSNRNSNYNSSSSRPSYSSPSRGGFGGSGGSYGGGSHGGGGGGRGRR